MKINDLMKRTTVFMVIFAAAAVAAVCVYSSNKIAVVAESEQGQTITTTKSKEDEADSSRKLLFSEDEKKSSYLCIPLEDSIRVGDITTENHYMDDQLWVGLKGASSAYYDEAKLSGSHSRIKDAYRVMSGDKLWLKFDLDGVYEYKSVYENGGLYIEFVQPHEKYDRIVVIDAAYGKVNGSSDLQYSDGRDEVTLAIAQDLEKLLEDTDIRVYYTRMGASSPGEEKRVSLANAVKADMLIRIEVGDDSDSKVYGTQTIYNSAYFIPGFGSVELADMLERQSVTSLNGKAIGLKAAGTGDYVISHAQVPAAAIKIGYMTNVQEKRLLERDDYRQKAADGIYKAIINCCKLQDESRDETSDSSETGR